MDIFDAASAQLLEEVGTRHLSYLGSSTLGNKAPDEPVYGQQKPNLLCEFAGRREDARAEIVGELQRDGRHAEIIPGRSPISMQGRTTTARFRRPRAHRRAAKRRNPAP